MTDSEKCVNCGHAVAHVRVGGCTQVDGEVAPFRRCPCKNYIPLRGRKRAKEALLLRKRLWWCRVCDRIQDAGGGHKDGCLGWWEGVTEAQAKDFFERMEEIAHD